MKQKAVAKNSCFSNPITKYDMVYAFHMYPFYILIDLSFWFDKINLGWSIIQVIIPK